MQEKLENVYVFGNSICFESIKKYHSLDLVTGHVISTYINKVSMQDNLNSKLD